jgi:ArsR family transcriptional regulator
MSKQGSVATSVGVCCAPVVAEALDPARAVELARAFKALGDPVRLRLLALIASADEGEICVCELTAPFELAGPTISHHLKVLRQAGLIDGDRRGTWIYYRVVPSAVARLSNLLGAAAGAVPTAATGP